MQKRLVWIIVGALVTGAILLLVRLRPESDQFDRLMTRGAGYLENADATNAVATCLQAVNLVPESLDARLNLANAYLLADDNQKSIEQCQEALNLDRDSAAAYYLMGLAYLHLNQAEPFRRWTA